MARPEGIPQDVWDATLRAIYAPGFPGGDLPTAIMEQDIQSIVAHAIMAERERCAKIIDDANEHYATLHEAAKTSKPKSEARDLQTMRIATAGLSSIIRGAA